MAKSWEEINLMIKVALVEYGKAVRDAERERCAKIAETVGLGEPHSMPPYSVREYIAKEIRGVDNVE
jgi:hypothetical protein